MRKLNSWLKYYLLTSYRRKYLDKALEEHKHYFKGKILDVGGGKQDGKFQRDTKQEWTVIDINGQSKPDVIASVEKLPFKNETFDTIKATELFEHVDDFEKGLKECARVLKKGGYFVLSTPFMFPVHADPDDFQRFTLQKWKNLTKRADLKIIVSEEQGHFFSIFSEMLRMLVVNIKISPLRFILYLTFPILDLVATLDKKRFIKTTFMNYFVEGYFLVLRK